MWRALDKSLLGGWMNEWVNEWWDAGHPAVQLLGVSLFSCSVSQFLSWGVGLTTRFPLPSREKGFGSPQSVCRLSHEIVYFLSVPCWVILSDLQEKERTITPKSIKKLAQGVGRGKQEYQPKHLQPRLCNPVSFENQVIQSPTRVTLITAFSLPLQPGSWTGMPSSHLLLRFKVCPRDSPSETNSQEEWCGPAHCYIPVG